MKRSGFVLLFVVCLAGFTFFAVKLTAGSKDFYSIVAVFGLLWAILIRILIAFGKEAFYRKDIDEKGELKYAIVTKITNDGGMSNIREGTSILKLFTIDVIVYDGGKTFKAFQQVENVPRGLKAGNIIQLKTYKKVIKITDEYLNCEPPQDIVDVLEKAGKSKINIREIIPLGETFFIRQDYIQKYVDEHGSAIVEIYSEEVKNNKINRKTGFNTQYYENGYHYIRADLALEPFLHTFRPE